VGDKIKKFRWAGRMGEGRGVYRADPGVVERIILKCIVRKWGLGLWPGSSWPRIGTGGEHF
jgi:hypothetical protein